MTLLLKQKYDRMKAHLNSVVGTFVVSLTHKHRINPELQHTTRTYPVVRSSHETTLRLPVTILVSSHVTTRLVPGLHTSSRSSR